MINAIAKGVIDIFMFIVGVISTVVFTPFYFMVSAIIPDISDYFTIASNLLNDYLFNGIAFVKQCFLNLTGFPNTLLIILVDFFLARITFMATKRIIIFIKNIWSIITSGSSGGMIE